LRGTRVSRRTLRSIRSASRMFVHISRVSMGRDYSQLSAMERNDLHSRSLNGESLRSIARGLAPSQSPGNSRPSTSAGLSWIEIFRSLVGYYVQQIGDDTGAGATLGDSGRGSATWRVTSMQGYKEFAAQNRPEGWTPGSRLRFLPRRGNCLRPSRCTESRHAVPFLWAAVLHTQNSFDLDLPLRTTAQGILSRYGRYGTGKEKGR
jgi:hypothetical protein